MKLDCVLTSVNLNKKYSQFIPLFIKSWNKLLPHVDVKIVLINDSIPKEYEMYKSNIILFKPIDNIFTAFIAQYIRILYPALLNYKNGILISDVDMIPTNEKYYTENIKNIQDDKFVIFRNVIPIELTQYPICYNIATSNVWKNIFDINNIEDVKNRLIKANSEIKYANARGGSGWDKDQRDLYSRLVMYENKVILNDKANKFKRLNRFKFNKDINVIKNDIINKIYTDYHAEYDYELNNKIIDLIPKYKKDIILLVIASRSEFYDKIILNHWIRYIKYVEENYKNVKIYLIFGKNKFGKNTNIDKFDIIRENILILDNEDTLIPGIYNKTINAFKKINLSYDYKFVFRTNLSSFIRINLLVEKINTISSIYGVIGNHGGINFVSGAGMLLNRENIEYILSNQNKINKNLPDDVALSSIFNISMKKENNLRYDFLNNNLDIDIKTIEKYYHFRIKNKNRDNDLIIFDKLYNIFFK